MMTSSDVIEVLSLLDDAGPTAWVDGGWSVDAPLGEATREHADLDLVVLGPQLAAVRSVLTEAGYASVLRDLLPASVAVADGQGHQVDLHPVTPTPRRWRRPGPGGWWELPLPPPVQGSIDGRPVGCVDAQTQVCRHLGYPPSDKDRQDMRRLHQRLGVELPAALR
jgi:lincosamide nucleotidyltransferase A/C/D/E